MKFVLVCFMLLAAVFYGLSGGSDFVPRSVERAAASASAETTVQGASETPTPRRLPAPQPIQVREEVAPETQPQRAEPRVTAAVAANTAPARASTQIFARPLEPNPDQDVTLVSLEQSAALFAQPLDDTDSGEIIQISPSPSLAAALTSPVTAAPAPKPQVPVAEEQAPQPDIRRVKGNVVNLRGGPGTTFAVLTSLTQDTEVEILEEPGNGWVQLRSVNGGPVGWMAEYLITN